MQGRTGAVLGVLMTASATGQAAVREAADVQAPALRLGGHIPALDGLRGLAILLVMIQHFMDGATGSGAAGTLAVRLAKAGWVGVDLFFVLSGFLITGILVDAKDSPHYFRNFYMRRVLRIFPLYYGVLAVLFFVLPWLVAGTAALARSQQNQWWLWVYGTNVSVIFQDVAVPGQVPLQVPMFVNEYFNLTHLWSLAVEEHFYMVWPLVVYVCSRKWIVRVCVGCMAGAAAVRLGLAVWMPEAERAVPLIYMLTPCRVDALALGGLLAVLGRGEGGARGLMRPAMWAGGIGAAAAVAIFMRPREGGGALFAAAEAVRYSVLAVLFGALLIWTVGAGKGSVPGRVFANPAARFLGKYSYGIYIFHGLLLQAFAWMFGPERLAAKLGSEAGGRAAYVALAGGASVGVAYASWHLFEKHFLKLKNYFEYARPETAGGRSGGGVER